MLPPVSRRMGRAVVGRCQRNTRQIPTQIDSSSFFDRSHCCLESSSLVESPYTCRHGVDKNEKSQVGYSLYQHGQPANPTRSKCGSTAGPVLATVSANSAVAGSLPSRQVHLSRDCVVADS